MNVAAILALIGDLYAQISVLRDRVNELEAEQTKTPDAG